MNRSNDSLYSVYFLVKRISFIYLTKTYTIDLQVNTKSYQTLLVSRYNLTLFLKALSSFISTLKTYKSRSYEYTFIISFSPLTNIF